MPLTACRYIIKSKNNAIAAPLVIEAVSPISKLVFDKDARFSLRILCRLVPVTKILIPKQTIEGNQRTMAVAKTLQLQQQPRTAVQPDI